MVNGELSMVNCNYLGLVSIPPFLLTIHYSQLTIHHSLKLHCRTFHCITAIGEDAAFNDGDFIGTAVSIDVA